MGWGMRKEIQDSFENHICLTTENEAEMRINMCLISHAGNLGEERRELGREGGRKRGGLWSRKGENWEGKQGRKRRRALVQEVRAWQTHVLRKAVLNISRHVHWSL